MRFGVTQVQRIDHHAYARGAHGVTPADQATARVHGEASAALERKRGQVAARMSALEEGASRLSQSRDEAAATRMEAEEALQTLAATQARLLDALWPLLAPGGVLLWLWLAFGPGARALRDAPAAFGVPASPS